MNKIIQGQDQKGKVIIQCPHCKMMHHLGHIKFKNIRCKCGERINNPEVERHVEILNEQYEKMKNKWNPKPLSSLSQFEAFEELKEKWKNNKQ